MTLLEVRERVAAIEKMRGDPEAQHSMEDDLYIETLKAIAVLGGYPGMLASAALRATELEFPRWCA